MSKQEFENVELYGEYALQKPVLFICGGVITAKLLAEGTVVQVVAKTDASFSDEYESVIVSVEEDEVTYTAMLALYMLGKVG